jgi:hypothetical protein
MTAGRLTMAVSIFKHPEKVLSLPSRLRTALETAAGPRQQFTGCQYWFLGDDVAVRVGLTGWRLPARG